MDFGSIRSDSSDDALDDRDDSFRHNAEGSREKRDTLEMLGPDYLDLVKDDNLAVKENRFTVNLARETSHHSNNITSLDDTALEQDKSLMVSKKEKRLKSITEPTNFFSEQRLKDTLRSEEYSSEKKEYKRTQKLQATVMTLALIKYFVVCSLQTTDTYLFSNSLSG